MMKWTLPNVASTPPRSPEGTERDASLCGVNSKDPHRIEFLELEDVGADGVGDASGNEADMIGAANEVPCTSRFLTYDANG
jgi:hypothetical protein